MTNTKKTRPEKFPLAGCADDGWSNEDEATATCLCGAVQLAVPLKAPGFVESFVCNCPDCHKLTASMYASNFTVHDSHLRHLRGKEKMKTFEQSQTVASGMSMTNYFCGECGGLMYRVGARFPGRSILRIGTVDDFSLHDTVLRPTSEQWCGMRNGFVKEKEGMKQYEGESHLPLKEVL